MEYWCCLLCCRLAQRTHCCSQVEYGEPLAYHSLVIVVFIVCVCEIHWGELWWILVKEMHCWVQYLKSFRDSGRNGNYKGYGAGCLLLVVIDTLEKEKEELRVINHQLKAKCESQRVFLAAHKETLISHSQRVGLTKDQSQDLNIRIKKLQKR